jgi:hypothetical protein
MPEDIQYTIREIIEFYEFEKKLPKTISISKELPEWDYTILYSKIEGMLRSFGFRGKIECKICLFENFITVKSPEWQYSAKESLVEPSKGSDYLVCFLLIISFVWIYVLVYNITIRNDICPECLVANFGYKISQEEFFKQLKQSFCSALQY